MHEERELVGVNGMFTPLGIARLHYCKRAAENQVASILYRIGRRLPPRDPGMLNVMAEVARDEFLPYVSSVPLDLDWSVEDWLDNTSYSTGKKNIARNCALNSLFHTPFVPSVVPAFMKDEGYDPGEWSKYPRMIFPRPSVVPLVGPAFSLIEKAIYQHPAFVKGYSTAARVNLLEERVRVDGAEYYATDYSSYESHMTREVMFAVLFPVLEKFLAQVAGGAEAYAMLIRSCLPAQFVITRHARFRVVDALMSGDRWTALFNTLFNWVCMKTAERVYGLEILGGLVEGDDGIFAFAPGCGPTTGQMEALGCIIKIEQRDTLEEASFCGLVYSEADRLVVPDVANCLLKASWLPGSTAELKPAKRLMFSRLRALSYAHQYGNIPILGAWCRRVIQLTQNFHAVHGFLSRTRSFSEYEKDVIRSALDSIEGLRGKEILERLGLDAPVPMDTRVLVAKTQHMDIHSQILYEALIEDGDGSPLHYPGLMDEIETAGVYFGQYVRPCIEVGTESKFCGDFAEQVDDYVQTFNLRLSLIHI